MKQLKGLLITLICILPCAVFAQFQGTYSGFVGDIINLNPSTVANQIFSIDWKAMSGSVDCVNVRTYGGSTVGATVEINKYFTGTVRIRASYKTVSNTTKTEYFDIECNAVTLTPNPSNLNMKVGETEDITFSISPSGKSRTVDYTSSNTSVATVGYLGRVTAIAKGYATITLSNNMGPNATVNVSVDGGSGGGGTGGGSDISDEGYYYDNTEEGYQMLFYKTYYYGDCAKVIKTPDDGACISSTTPGKVTVPNVAKDYPVRIIGNWAFSNLPHITDIVLPQSTTVIENYCVYNCTDLQTITCLSENPPSCYSTSFHGCEKMTLYVKSKSAKEKYAVAEGWKWFKTIKVIGEEDDIQVTGITLNTYSVTLSIGDTKQLSATISPSNATNKSVTWSTSNSSVATVSSSGLVTAKSAGSATITCRADDGSGKYATCDITVNSSTIYVTNISLNKTSETMEVGDFLQLYETITPSNATNKSVTWSTSNSSVATVSSSGLVTAKKEGSATITCKAKDGSGKYATCSITVKNSVVYVTSISLNTPSATLAVGDTKQLTATISPSNATNKSVTWSTNNSSVATVSSSGLVIAKSEGSATITCKAKDGSGKYATCSITVKNSTVYVTSVNLSTLSATLAVGDTKQLTATISPSNATNKSVTWSTSNSSVATVSSSGLVTAKSSGKTTITCKANDGSGKYATCSVEVGKVTGIDINESNFPDEKFRKYLLSKDYGADGVLTENEILNISSIDVSYTVVPKLGIVIPTKGSVHSLKGIEFFTALTSLNCRNNILTSIDVSKNTKLTELNCGQNSLSSLDLSKNTELEYLSCGYNQLTFLDVSKNTALKNLYCNGNEIKGPAMDALINGLPQNVTNSIHNFGVISYQNDGNVCTISQVAVVKAKGWTPVYNSGNEWLEYEGSEEMKSGSEENPFTPAEANEYGSSLASNEQSETDYYIRGMVVSIKEQFGTQYGNATFYISADGTEKDQFYIYRALYLGNTKYAGQDLQLRVGDDVVVCGKITNYLGNLPETVQNKAYVVSINGETTGINSIKMCSGSNDASIYNLRGQRLTAPQKGINIIGGKKFVVK